MEKFTQVGDSSELVVVDFSRGIFQRTGEEIEGMDNAVAFSECGLDEVVMHEFDGVRDHNGFRDGICHSEAPVVVEGRSDAVAVASAEGPRPSRGGLVVN